MIIRQRLEGARWSWGALALLAGLLFFNFAAATAAEPIDSAAQGFYTSGKVLPGWVVALKSGATATVEAAPAADSTQIYGVAVNASAAPATLSATGQQVFVATSGNYPVLVSAVNGKISAGDYISMSNTDGIAAEATDLESYILGRAVSGFDGQHKVISGSGSSAIGSIIVSISPGHNPQKEQSSVPAPVKKIANAVAGHTITAARIWAAVATFLLAFVMGLVLLVVGVRSAITGIGRNPLSRHSILLGLSQVATIAILIFIAGIFGVYLLLKL